MNSHPRHALDDLLIHPVRLSIMAALVTVERADFAAIRDIVEITDPALSKQIALLEAGGYLDIGKTRVARRSRTWLSLTPAGRDAYARHIQALQAIANPAGTPQSTGQVTAHRRVRC